ncbi:DUF262 domain-containing protein [Mycolicibacterium septicum]|uniref:DUF262 domain-containing protein n=1 Tax=Mycolicibacterium septicum TaxID=98668 RepID=A0ABW9LV89_9MYCO
MDESVNKRYLTLSEILRLIELGALGLPDFQRRFKWGAEQVQSFLATVIMGWPAGLILLMEAPPKNFFAVRNLEGVDQDASAFTHLILDGQQRVTALAQAFGLTARPGDPIWYVDITQLESRLPIGDIDDAFVRRFKPVAFDINNPLIPLSALRDAANFQQWRDSWFDSQIIGDDQLLNDMFDRINRLWVNSLARTPHFDLPCTVVPADMPLGSVSMIFEKLNTAGARLDTFDLVVAHVYRDGRNLRTAWEQEVAQRPVLQHFAPSDPLIAAELIAMVHKGDTRRSGLLSLEPGLLWDTWPRAVSAIESAARFLAQQAGISNSAELPHRGILLSLAGLAYRLDGLESKYDDLLLYWTYSRGLAERFNAAVNTRVVSEFRELISAAQQGRIRRLAIPASGLQNATIRANSSILKTLQAMIRRNGPLDYPDGLLSVRLSADKSTPVSLFGGSSEVAAERVLGIILGTPRTAVALRHRSLDSIHAELQSVDSERSRLFARSQMLPDVDSSAWRDVSIFIKARESLVIDAVEELYVKYASSVVQQSPALSIDSLEYTRDWVHKSDGIYEFDLPFIAMRENIPITLESGGNTLHELARLTQSRQPMARTERLGARLLYARALELAGRSHDAIEELEIADRDASGAELDSELMRLKPLIAAELGRTLIRSGRIDEGVVALTDALNSISTRAASPLVQASMLLECARGLAQLGDRHAAFSIAYDLLNGGVLGIGDEFPELVAAARQIIEATNG